MQSGVAVEEIPSRVGGGAGWSKDVMHYIDYLPLHYITLHYSTGRGERIILSKAGWP